MSTSWKDRIRNIAPAIGSALGAIGVPGASALAAVSQALLGKPDATEAEVEARVAGWQPDDELKLRAAEQAFTLSLLDKVVASEAVDAGDRANARAREIALKDWVPPVLAVSTALAFFTLLYVMFARAIPDPNKAAFDILLGILAGAMTQVLNYYFGSSSGSAAARSVIGRIAEKKS